MRSMTQPISASALSSARPSSAGHWLERQQLRALRGYAPQLLGDEGHERVQQLEDFVARPGDRRLRFLFRRPVGPEQHRLHQLDIPVAIDVPDEAIGGGGRLVEAIVGDRGGDFLRGFRRLVCDPAVERFLRGSSDRSRSTVAQPFISAKRTAFQSLVAKLRLFSTSCGPRRMSWPCAAPRASVKRSASAPYWSMTPSGSTTLPFDFDILAPGRRAPGGGCRRPWNAGSPS